MSGGRICSSGQSQSVWHICRANPSQCHPPPLPRQWCHHLHHRPYPARSPPSTIRTKLFVTRWKINGQSWKHSQFWKGEFSTQFEQYYSHPVFHQHHWRSGIAYLCKLLNWNGLSLTWWEGSTPIYHTSKSPRNVWFILILIVKSEWLYWESRWKNNFLFFHFSHFSALNLLQMNKTIGVLARKIKDFVYEHNLRSYSDPLGLDSNTM